MHLEFFIAGPASVNEGGADKATDQVPGGLLLLSVLSGLVSHFGPTSLPAPDAEGTRGPLRRRRHMQTSQANKATTASTTSAITTPISTLVHELGAWFMFCCGGSASTGAEACDAVRSAATSAGVGAQAACMHRNYISHSAANYYYVNMVLV